MMRKLGFLKSSPAAAVAVLALALSVSGVAYGATGGNFILGQPNTATSETKLSSNSATQTLGLTNSANKPAARFITGPTAAPFSVTSQVKVGNLNADKLDGLDSTGFVKAGPCAPVASCTGRNAGGAIGVVPGSTGTIALVPGLFTIQYDCPANLNNQGVITYVNTSAATENVYADSGGDNPNYQQLAAGGTSPLPATAAGDSFVWQIQHPTIGLATIHAASVNHVGDNFCGFQVQAVVTFA
jgi:hypothetical protein